jgi:putative acetyltransferase
VVIHAETPADAAAISEVNIAAFLHHPYGAQTEHLIVEALRDAGVLEVSLVAEEDGDVVGHIAFSRASIGDAAGDWYLLGPVAVLPERQGRGVGSALVEAGLDELRSRGASACVLVGDPAFYRRFGFGHPAGLTWHGVPDENVLGLALAAEAPAGAIGCHPAFFITAPPH